MFPILGNMEVLTTKRELEVMEDCETMEQEGKEKQIGQENQESEQELLRFSLPSYAMGTSFQEEQPTKSDTNSQQIGRSDKGFGSMKSSLNGQSNRR